MAAIKYIDMYKDFLTIVRKSRVGTVEPKEFTSFINLAQEEAISSRLQVMDLNKKFMDDLLPLRVVSGQLPLTMDTTIGSRYKSGVVDFPVGYRRMSRVIALLQYTTGVSPNVVTSDVYSAKTNLIKSNEISSIVDGIYSKPTLKNCYYHSEHWIITTVIHDGIKVYVPYFTYVSTYPKCILEYYTTPTAITEANVVSSSETCVFNKEVCTDIVNIAARMYLESVQDARYQTFNNELKQKN